MTKPLIKSLKYKSNFLPETKKDVEQDKQIVTLKKKVKQLSKYTERKYLYLQNQLFANITSTPQTQLLNGISRGNTVQTRDGDYITAKSIQIQGLLSVGMSASPYQSAVRIMIVRWDDSNNATTFPVSAATPATGYLFNTATPYTYAMYNFNNMDIASSFKILYDKVHTLVMPTTASAITKRLDIKVNCKDHKVSYKGGNVGTGADIDTGQYWLISFTDNTTAGTNFRYDAKFNFVD